MKFTQIIVATMAVAVVVSSAALPVRSSLGGEGEGYTEEEDIYIPPASDYVQSGLILLLDGIENSDWGVHDSAATEWNDLMGSGAWSIDGNAYWTGLSLRRSVWGSDAITQKTGRWAGYPNFEIVFSIDILWTGNNYIKLGRSGTLFLDRVRYLNYSHTPNKLDATVPLYQPMSISVMGTTIYVNGQKVEQLSEPTSSYSGENDTQRFLPWVPGEIYCIRRYSRVLTADEVEYNYELDKARFGL